MIRHHFIFGAILILLLPVVSISINCQAAEHEHAMHDEHAAHRAMMEKTTYAVTSVNYTIPELGLIDQFGESIKLTSIIDGDKPLVINFIYTTCTTICPVMTATFSQMRRQLGETVADVKFISISIDPEYDRPQVLKEYAELFHAGPDWSFLTGDSNNVFQVVRSMDAYFGSKMNHRPLTLLKRPNSDSWIRIEGLASAKELAHEVTTRLLN